MFPLAQNRYIFPKMPYKNHDLTAADISARRWKAVPIDSLCYAPFSDLSCYIFPFRKPQVVLKIEKEITVLHSLSFKFFVIKYSGLSAFAHLNLNHALFYNVQHFQN
jgi:hypothetical protein